MDDASMETIVGRFTRLEASAFNSRSMLLFQIADLLAHGHESISIQIDTMLLYEIPAVLKHQIKN